MAGAGRLARPLTKPATPNCSSLRPPCRGRRVSAGLTPGETLGPAPSRHDGRGAFFINAGAPSRESRPGNLQKIILDICSRFVLTRPVPSTRGARS